jgi:hypothetical protein
MTPKYPELQTWADTFKALSPAEIRLGTAMQEFQPRWLKHAADAYRTLAVVYAKLPHSKKQVNHARQMWNFYDALYDNWLGTQRLMDAHDAHRRSEQGLRRSDIDAARPDNGEQEADRPSGATNPIGREVEGGHTDRTRIGSHGHPIKEGGPET